MVTRGANFKLSDKLREIKPIIWQKDKIAFLDQSKLPWKEEYLVCHNYKEVAEAIRSMKVRGAPAIGVAAALGIALGILKSKKKTTLQLFNELEVMVKVFKETRPTAVNLFWAVDKMKKKGLSFLNFTPKNFKKFLIEEALNIFNEDIETNKKIGKLGIQLIDDNDTVLTHCNTGALATGGYGTALGIIRYAWKKGKKVFVFVTETRPLLQGARLTTWELKKENIPFSLITDNMAGYLMRKKEIKKVLVGADRIAANGDVANKIGTYTLAILAKEHSLPFYIAAPTSSIDLNLDSGEEIPIEERSSVEVTHLAGQQIAPDGIGVRNPSFDVTPHRYISAIITEKGIVYPPFKLNLAKVKNS